MAICTICGKKFKTGTCSGVKICCSEECWKKAWNDAIAPFKRKKAERTVKKSKRNYNRTTSEQKKRIVELYNQGKTGIQIAEQLGIERHLVYYYMRRAKSGA